MPKLEVRSRGTQLGSYGARSMGVPPGATASPLLASTSRSAVSDLRPPLPPSLQPGGRRPAPHDWGLTTEELLTVLPEKPSGRHPLSFSALLV